MRAWQNQHMNGGSYDLEYGSVICPCGIWMEGRTRFDDWLVQVGSNGSSYANSHWTSVQLMVGVREGITPAETAWLAEAVRTLRTHGWGDQIRPHSDFYATACPGDAIRGAIPQIRRLADNPPQEGTLKRIDYAHRKDDRTIKTGEWVTITKKMKTGRSGTQTMMLSQGLIRPDPKITGAWVRFVRVKPKGGRDGTGDQYMAASPAGNLHWSHNHTVESGNFEWVVEVKVASDSPQATLAYSISKSFI